MKSVCSYLLAVLLLVLMGVHSPAFAQSVIPDSLTLIAHYPLQSNADDTTNTYGPMTLTNAPFGDGGIQLSGIYVGAIDPTNASDAITPRLDALNFDAFALRVDFKMPEADYPVLIGGDNFRWMGAWIFPDSVLYMEANNYTFIERSNAKIDMDTWYTLTMTYSAAEGKGRWFLNETEVGSVDFVPDHGNDQFVGVTQSSIGATFKGTIRNLKVYSYTGMPTALEEATVPAAFRLHGAYPNPFNPSTTITYDLPEAALVTLRVYDMLGRDVHLQHLGHQSAGAHQQVTFEAGVLASGLYIYRVEALFGARQEVRTGRLVLMK